MSGGACLAPMTAYEIISIFIGILALLMSFGKIKDMSDRTELLQEKADDLERVKRYAGAAGTR